MNCGRGTHHRRQTGKNVTDYWAVSQGKDRHKGEPALGQGGGATDFRWCSLPSAYVTVDVHAVASDLPPRRLASDHMKAGCREAKPRSVSLALLGQFCWHRRGSVLLAQAIPA